MAAVGARQVVEARKMLRAGNSTQCAAIRLGVLSRDLDKALWRYFGLSDADIDPRFSRRPPPMF